jgi:hypothetical protein
MATAAPAGTRTDALVRSDSRRVTTVVAVAFFLIVAAEGGALRRDRGEQVIEPLVAMQRLETRIDFQVGDPP